VKLAILGGGGFRVPLIYQALAADGDRPLIRELRLFDPSPDRLAVIRNVLNQLGAESRLPTVTYTSDLDEAIADVDFVFSAIRVGGLQGRVQDERAALRLGVIGQETTGPGGIAYGLRTIPVATAYAERIAQLAPTAYVINFTNPAGMITEAMQTVLGPRVIGICDTPSGLATRIAGLYDVPLQEVEIDYVGLNHLGWLRRLTHGGRDLVADLLAEDRAIGRLEEGQVFGAEWLRTLGSVPNEYLYYYYYFNRDAVRAILQGGQTRGEFLRSQQTAFYAKALREPATALSLWHTARDEREATYMTETRPEGHARPDLSGGGYERVALDLMTAIARDQRATIILNVPNGSTVQGMPEDAVVEVPCVVDADGVHPLTVSAPTGDQLGLMQQMKTVERLTIEAAMDRRPDLALKALALHPLVDSVTVAQQLFSAYREATPELFATRPPGRVMAARVD
jgi:6-phospho-beta-glucosidase